MDSSACTHASQRAVANHDIVLELVKHLDEGSVHAFLLTCKAFAAAAIPRLYRRIEVDQSRPSLFLDLSPTGPPTEHPANESLVCPPETAPSVEGWTKRSAWAHVRDLSIRIHGESACPGRLYPDSVPALPKLQHIHLSGGDSTLEMGLLCTYHSCPLLDRYRTTTLPRLTIRKLDQLPDFTSVSHVTLLLRPCQLPFEPRGGVTYSAGTFRPLAGLRTLDIVLWDEQHQHRIDWVHHPATTQPPVKGYPAVGAMRMAREWRPEHRAWKTKGCAYCDQSGCLRYSPNAPKQVPGLVYSAARWTGATAVGLWNAEKCVRENQWWDSKMTVEECWKAVREAAERGRKERREEVRAGASDVGEEEDDTLGERVRAITASEAGGTSTTNAASPVTAVAASSRAIQQDCAKVDSPDEAEVNDGVDVSIRTGLEWVEHAAADLEKPDWTADREYWTQVA